MAPVPPKKLNLRRLQDHGRFNKKADIALSPPSFPQRTGFVWASSGGKPVYVGPERRRQTQPIPYERRAQNGRIGIFEEWILPDGTSRFVRSPRKTRQANAPRNGTTKSPPKSRGKRLGHKEAHQPELYAREED